jgi:hypothetical protein
MLMQQIMIENHTWISHGVYVHSPVHGVDDTSISQVIEERMG